MGILEYVLGHIFTCVDAHVLKWRGYKKFLSLSPSLSPTLSPSRALWWDKLIRGEWGMGRTHVL